MCVAALAPEALEVPGVNFHFTINPILRELEVGIYVGTILPVPLADLLSGRRPGGDGRDGGGSGSGSSGGGKGSGRLGGGAAA